MPESIDWPMRPAGTRHRVLLLTALAILIATFLGGKSTLSYYIDALWFGSLGYAEVFWTTLRIESLAFLAFTAATFFVLYIFFLALKRAHLPNLPNGHTIYISGEPIRLPVEPVLRWIGLGVSLVIAVGAGASMMLEWPTLALYWF